MHPKGWEQIQKVEAESGFQRPAATPDSSFAPPVFTKHLSSHENLKEGQCTHIEATVESSGDHNLKVEWYKNGVELTTGKSHTYFKPILHKVNICNTSKGPFIY